MKRTAYIIRSSVDGKRHIAIDSRNEYEILAFLKKDKARLRKFYHVAELILSGIKNPELYDKEEIDKSMRGVTAIKLFKGGQNAAKR